jgi:PPOX class probable F420-dependent enzyme
MMLSEDVRKHLTAGHLGHLTTINPDGTPHTTIVWVDVQGETIVSGHFTDTYKKIRNIRRDPRVSLSMEFGTINEHGQHHYAVIEGVASVEEGGAKELLQKEARVYVGPDVVFPGPDAPPGFVVRLKPTRIRGVLPWD